MSFRFAALVIVSTALATLSSLAQNSPASSDTVRVLAPHWVALQFDPKFPHGRHTQGALPEDGLVLPAPANFPPSTKSIPTTVAEYRIPVPNFAADAGVDQVVLIADLQGTAKPPKLEGTAGALGPCPADACSALGLSASRLAALKVLHAQTDHFVDPVELTINASIEPGETFHLYDATGPAKTGPMLLLHTRETVSKPTGWHSAEQSGLDLPHITPLFNDFMRDTAICTAPDGYYMTGTTGDSNGVSGDLSVWKSNDLKTWNPVIEKPKKTTVVWNLDRDGSPWIKTILKHGDKEFRPLWAPEIHYINGTFWIPLSVPQHGITILKSTTGKAEGPYEVAIKPDAPLSTGIDASLFQDDDGTVYSLYGGGWIAKMKPDMSGLAESYHHLASASGREVGFEGVSMFKDKGVYYLNVADFVLGEYNTYIATATSLSGPWSERYLAVPHAGHANFFRDKQGRMWSTFFGNDRHAPFHTRPAIVPMMQDNKGRWRPAVAIP